jgi:PhzF family phenazine biosynthesis protein
MRFRLFQASAFATSVFSGNPAAVVPLDCFLADSVLQSIARENNLAETAFLVPEGGEYRVRWFTPTTEVPLCGHATLASAAAVMERLEPHRDRVIFHSASGPLTVIRSDERYVMDFPARPSAPIPAPLGLIEALGLFRPTWPSTLTTTSPCSRASRWCVNLHRTLRLLDA